MMMRLLLKKYVNESLLLFLACGSMLFAFCWARVWIICQFDLQQFAPMLKQLKPFERFSPVPLEQFLTYSGNIAMTFHEPVLILCIVVWGISRGSDVVSGEIGRGTLEMLLSQPISRSRMLMAHAIVCVTGLVLLCCLAWLGVYVGIQTNVVKESIAQSIEVKVPFLPIQLPVQVGESIDVETPLSDRVDPGLYLAPVVNLFGFGFFLLGISTMFSCLDRYRWRTIGTVISVYVVQLLLFLLSKATDWTNAAEWLTFFSLYQPDGMVQAVRQNPGSAFELLTSQQVPGWEYVIGPLGMSVCLVAMGCIFYGIGWVRFRNRDLPAPL